MILSGILIKEWFKSLIGAIAVLFLLISTAELINGFLQGKDSSRVLLEYLLKMPEMMGRLFPICSLVASLFSLNKLKGHSELIALLAAGFSYKRIYLLIGTCALSMVGTQFFNLGFLEPLANKYKRQEIQKSQKEGKYLTRSSLEGGKFWYKSENYFASFAYFDRHKLLLKDLEIYYFSDKHTSTKILSVDEAHYMNGKWVPTKVNELSNLDGPSFPLTGLVNSKELPLGEVPEDFGEFEADLTTLTFFKLAKFVSRLSRTGINVSEYEILLMNKVFLSFVCLVFALIPVSTIFNPNRRSSSFGKNVVLTLLVTVGFWVLYSSAVAFGNSGKVPPLVATGIVPCLFFLFVVVTFIKNRKLAI
ncbi:MAG: LptF/LptG family permease [Bacteriovoracaceae bacterium]